MNPTQFVADTQLQQNQKKAKALGVNIPAPQIAPTISANELLNSQKPIDLNGTFQEPKSYSYRGIIDNIRNDINTRETDYRKQQDAVAEREALFSGIADTSMGDIRSGLNSQYGLPDSLKELKDINLQLSDNKTNSELTKTKIQGAAGQTMGQAQREVTQEDREQAVRSAGLAARAAVLTDNIETARTLINDAMSDAYQDRTIKLKITEKQLDRAYQVADDNQKTILDQQREKIKVEMAQIEEVKAAVSEAVLNGATQSEIAQLTDPNMADEEKVSLAQSITARGVNQMRQLEIAQKQASIAASNRSNQGVGNEYGTLSGKPQNATQATANGFADRIAQANTSISLLGKNFTGDLAFGGNLPNWLQSSDRQAYEQAKKNFATAVLRRESGASIAPSEFETLNTTYFPVAGDDETVIQQKEELRNTVINSFYREANVPRPVIAGDVVEDNNGTQYRVGLDGETLEPIE